MNNKFDELATGMAQSVTRRGALKKFGVGLGVVALASLGLTNKAEAKEATKCFLQCKRECAQTYQRNTPEWDYCVHACLVYCY